MEPLTEKQHRVLGFIEGRLKDNDPPSQREVARHFGLAQNAVHQLIGYLRKKGYLVDSSGHRRLRLSAEYIAAKSRTEGFPVVGRVAAGEPILAEQNIQEYINLNDLFGRSKDIFLLKVTGDSMIDEGIMDGDLVVVKRTSAVKNGQIGVVLLQDEATVKRIYIQRDRIALKPANRAAGYKTTHIGLAEKDISIVGRVIGCLRTKIN